MVTLTEKHCERYTENAFLGKLKQNAKRAGMNTVYSAALLYTLIKDDEIPSKVKMIIMSALGYFILPFDTVPDIIPVSGYADDMGVMIVALSHVSMYVTREHKEKAKTMLRKYLGKVDRENISYVDCQL